MNFSGYFCLIATAILIVFAQQSEADAVFDKMTNYIEDGLDAIENKLVPGNRRCRNAINFIKQRAQLNINANTYVHPSIKLSESLINATKMITSSRSTMLYGVLAAEKIVGENPEDARKLTQQAYVDGLLILYSVGTPFFKALGEALHLSNDGTRQGLLSASQIILKGGLALLDIIESGQSLFNDGSEVGGRAAKESLNVYYLAIEAGFAALFYNLQKSTNESLQALTYAQSSPIQLQIKNLKCGATAKDDSESSDALEDINQVAKNTIRNGANPALVQELEEIVKCALDSFIQTTAEAKRMLANNNNITGVNTFATATMVSKDAATLRKRINQLFAQLYLDFADVYVRSGNQSDKEFQSGFVNLQTGFIRILNVIKSSEQILKNGIENGGDASMLAFESVAKSVYLAKLVFIQSIDECAKIVFSLL